MLVLLYFVVRGEPRRSNTHRTYPRRMDEEDVVNKQQDRKPQQGQQRDDEGYREVDAKRLPQAKQKAQEWAQVRRAKQARFV